MCELELEAGVELPVTYSGSRGQNEISTWIAYTFFAKETNERRSQVLASLPVVPTPPSGSFSSHF
eukprot:1920075-Rhodomonas_salina.7